jgi:two-component system invasion response regulator UvrY
MNEKIINIIIADDHALLRAGLSKIIKDENDMKVMAEANNGEELVELLKNQQPDFIILDLTMPGGGIELIKTVKKIYPLLKILVLSMHPEERFAVRAFKSGASGYMTKESAPELLVSAIRRIVSGGKYISSHLAEKLAEEIGEESQQFPHKGLSDREYQIFIMIASGKKVSLIAKELFLSIHTVNTYRSRILEKMNIKSSVEMTHYAMENGLID